jgi:hypothetical protein
MMEGEEDAMLTPLQLLRFCDAQFRLIARLVLEVEPRSDTPRVNARIEALIPELIAVCDRGGEALEMLLNAFVLREIKKTYPIATVSRELLPNMICLLEQLKRHFRRMVKDEPPPEHLADFEAAVKRFRLTAVQFLLKWPWFDPEQIKEFDEAIFERGDYQDAREALNELLHQARERAEGEDRVLATVSTPAQ